MPISIAALPGRARGLLPGFLIAGTIAIAARFLSEHYGGPAMLFALLLGMAVNFLGEEGKAKLGIEFTAREVLRIGVALLGLRITFAQIAALGWQPVALVVACVVATILVSILLARLMGFNPLFGLLSGGATAICGASAALALSAALPAHPGKERATLFTIIGVSALSTLAMILYPMLVKLLGLGPQEAGIFLGGTIHDVAQVVGAGYSLSPEVGDMATIVKLLRVAMLVPVILAAALITRAQGQEAGGKRPPLLPWFAVGFLLLAALNSTGWLPALVRTGGADASQWCLLAAIAAIGVKSNLGKLVSVGPRPVLLMLVETLLLAGLVQGGITLLR